MGRQKEAKAWRILWEFPRDECITFDIKVTEEEATQAVIENLMDAEGTFKLEPIEIK